MGVETDGEGGWVGEGGGYVIDGTETFWVRGAKRREEGVFSYKIDDVLQSLRSVPSPFGLLCLVHSNLATMTVPSVVIAMT